jgi:hypothetical protein
MAAVVNWRPCGCAEGKEEEKKKKKKRRSNNIPEELMISLPPRRYDSVTKYNRGPT